MNCEHDFRNIVVNHPSGVGFGDKMCVKCNCVLQSKCNCWDDEHWEEGKYKHLENCPKYYKSIKSIINPLF